MTEPEYLLVLSTCPPEQAGDLARALVSERLAACVNQLAGVRSCYRWQGEVREDSECLLVIKTRRDRFAVLRDRLAELHSNSVPEIIAVPVVEGIAAYLDWIDESLAPVANQPE